MGTEVQTSSNQNAAKAFFQSTKSVFTAKGEVKASHALGITAIVAAIAAGVAYYISRRKAKRTEAYLIADAERYAAQALEYKERLAALATGGIAYDASPSQHAIAERIHTNL